MSEKLEKLIYFELKKINKSLNIINQSEINILEIENIEGSNAYIWDNSIKSLRSIDKVNSIDLSLFVGIEENMNILIENTVSFASGNSANNALLWGARGMGKSSLIKSVHNYICESVGKLILIDIPREDISIMTTLIPKLSKIDQNFLIFCDDLSFEKKDFSYRAIKSILDGGIESKPSNVIIYATSNRRHLMPREINENETNLAINKSDTIEEKISLSDRFGLWLGFHTCNQKDYLNMVFKYISHFNLKGEHKIIEKKALEWCKSRGGRSGRVAWQFILNFAGKQNRKI